MRNANQPSAAATNAGLICRLILSAFALVPLSCAAAPATVELSSPVNFQAFQRDTRFLGKVVVEGLVTLSKTNTNLLKLEARFSGASLSRESDWRALPLDLRVKRFRAELPVPAGGWYRLTVKLLEGTQ